MRHNYSCPRHGSFQAAMSPSDFRQATGRPVPCPRCGRIAVYRGIALAAPRIKEAKR